ncbi:MFS transporter [Streptoalloteichus hindustanus]|uniref:MFS transporter, DHA2 family, multidrug resistance protein n=1 Tax=Streptoalloteichus hindustanus TaxID=2017 RepID=A0A1M4YNT7_STRHI|nr:MFS transporter [Streptoalloteichus hindustanus]SHF07479.1 MFS transporter, DHA2 family, multidrug resistance protein [Streptoalloteichus hindustanus]
MTRETNGSATPDGGDHARAGAREWVGLVVLMLPVLLISVDATVLGFAVPYLSEELRPSGPQLLWIVDIYSFLLAGLLVTMGTLGDRIGRRRLLLMGTAGFGLASLLAAYAPDAATLIGGRALLGVAGATLMPSTLSLLRNMFHNERQRLFAIAVWGSAFSAGTALGPVIGGWLLEHFWWGSVFLINLPVVVVTLVAAPLLVPEYRDPAPGPFDIPSVLLSMLAILPVVYGIKTVAKRGLGVVPVAAIVVGLVLGYFFVRRQRKLEHPVIDVSLFRIRRFTVAIGTGLMVVFAITAALFLIPQYLQLVEGLSPLRAGLLLLPGAILSIAAGFVVAAAARHVGTPVLLSLGLTLSALGYVVLVWLPPAGGLVVAAVSFVLISFAEGSVMTLTNNTMLSTVPPERAGAASAISETAIELGAALGVAVLGSLATAVYQTELPVVPGVDEGRMEAARETLGGALTTAREVGGAAGEALTATARAAFTDSINVTSAIGAALMLYAAVQAWVLLRPSRPDTTRAQR